MRITIRVDEMRFLLLLTLSISWSISAVAQPTPKEIKNISGLKVKSVNSFQNSTKLFRIATSEAAGIWSNEENKVIIWQLQDVQPTPISDSLFTYSDAEGHGLVNSLTGKILVKSPSRIHITPTPFAEYFTLFSSHIIGFINTKTSKLYTVNENRPKQQKVLGDDDITYCVYNPKEDRITASEDRDIFGDPQFMFLSVFKSGSAIIVSSAFMETKSTIYDAVSGTEINQVEGYLEAFANGYYTRDYNFTYYNREFKPTYKNIEKSGFNVAQFRDLFDGRIEAVRYIDQYQYQINMLGMEGIFDVYEGSFVTDLYDTLIEVGPNYFIGGNEFFVGKNQKYGLYNDRYGEILRPKYKNIEFRAFQNGDYGYHTENELRKFSKNLRQYERFNTSGFKMQPLEMWEEKFQNQSMILSMLKSINENYILLSFRTTEADVHDLIHGGSQTLYKTNSGIYDLKHQGWVMGKKHSVSLIGDKYFTENVETSYENWKTTEVYDESMQPLYPENISGATFFYGGFLITINKDWELIAVDPSSLETKKVLGKVDRLHQDFRFIDNYLCLGHNRFSNQKELIGFDILQVITPELELINRKGFGFIKYIGDELVVVGNTDSNIEGDLNLYKRFYNPEKMAIYDLSSRKFLTDWYKNIWEYEGVVNFVGLANETPININIELVRKHFSK